MLAYGALSTDGKTLSITGNKFSAVYSGTEWDIEIAALTVFAISPEGDYYSYNGFVDMGMPMTLTKAGAGSSSVKSVLPFKTPGTWKLESEALRTRR